MEPVTFNGCIANGPPTNSSYNFDPQKKMNVPREVHSEKNETTYVPTSSSLEVSTATQDYYGYTSYPNPTNNYVYSNTGYQSYYYCYQQPASDSFAQQVGVNQNSGAPYQPLNSFQNSGSTVGSTSYSGTYYNPGDHQTTAGYQSSSYNNQSNVWNDGTYAGYNIQHYPSYGSSGANSTQSTSSVQHYPSYGSSGANSTQSTSSVPGNTVDYQYPYNQWSSYYMHPAPSVSCAPGTESISANPPSQSGSGGYAYANNQPPPPGTTSWRGDSGASVPTLQGKNEFPGYKLDGSWEVGPPTIPNQQTNQVLPYFKKPLDTNSIPTHSEDEQNNTFAQGSLQLSSTNQVPEKLQPPLPSVPVMDTHRVNKMQIPSNPRITSNLALGMSKVEKESPVSHATSKPAYISVPVPKANNRGSSHDDSEGIMKGAFPPSLRSYVERTFVRCKDDAQRAANQKIMKEIITSASADGSLFTRNWDIEPLFPLSDATFDKANENKLLGSVAVSSLSTYKRSPTRRTKSRWEPLPEEKLVEKLGSAGNEFSKEISWNQSLETERGADSRKFEPKDNAWTGVYLSAPHQQNSSNKFAQRPLKKPRLNDTDLTENTDSSSDSDKDQGLTKYYSSAMALANSPEERKKREHRSKRFEKKVGHQVEFKPTIPKVAGTGNLYSRRASVLMFAKSYDNNCIRAVEDIDWDALTVRGTCQEVEKHYLRLTSAPDPATVRPEDVLEKALEMVQASQKNYLYKCDQLKSIRQDLTVQRIQNELTVKVYETHARLALEAGDLPEYNQCQSQLKRLYAEGIKGSHMEFSAYHLLCVMLHSNNKRDLLSSMTRLSAEARENEAVKHALAVRRAVSSGNYVLFFRLYKAAPNLNSCLMDLYMEKMRFEAVRCMSRSYRPTVPISYISQVLGFSGRRNMEERADNHTDGLVECKEWLRVHGAIVAADNNGELCIETKLTSSSLSMPEADDAVPHGDVNLAVDDFLTRTA